MLSGSLTMDNNESIHRVISSAPSSNLSKSRVREEVFDEESVKQASLTEEVEWRKPREIDVKNLGSLEKKQLVERLVLDGEEGNEMFLKKLKQRFDRVGIDLPTIEVRFEHLSVEADAHVGGRALPTVVNFAITMVEGILGFLNVVPKKKKKKQFSILHDFNGLIKPGRLTLLLGPPSSGKSTLLLALAGRLHKDLKVGGKVTYNGHEMNEFVPERAAAYISQNDLHIGEMTVRETLAFSARCQGVGPRSEMLAELSRREKAANIKPDPDLDIYMKAASLDGQESSVVTDYVLKILGLDICADTIVGDGMFRGISGGEKRRVTTGEMLVGPAMAFFMDEISSGLDTSTTYQIVNSMKQFIHILQGTAVISLLQPPPETYNLFDDIILLSDGRLVYKGPLENVLEFFESLGFRCPPRKGVADFLQEVTSRKDQEQYWAKKDESYTFVTAREFAEAFQSFHVGRATRDELAVPFDRSKSHPAALTTKKYGINTKELLKALTAREYLLMKRNSFVYFFKMCQLILMGCVTMTVFLRTEMSKDTLEDGTVYMGALFLTIMMIMFNGFGETAMSIFKLPVYYKQKNLLFYPAWAYSIPGWILKIPISFLEVGVWVFITYYVIGYDPNAGRMFKMYLLLVLVHQMSSGLFRLIAALARDMTMANTFGSFAFLVVLVLGGFILSRDQISDWLIWGYWISPLMYAQTAITVNEFLGNSWRKFSANSTKSLGVLALESRGVFAEARWYWIGVGALFGYILLFNVLDTLSLSYLNSFDKPRSTLSDETLEERISCKTGPLKLPSENRAQTQRDTSSSLFTSKVGSTSQVGENKKKGMVLPFEPLSITFESVRYSVDMPQEMKFEGVSEDRLQLLKGVSGSFRPGVLTALMGVSGAGKTTLMDVLAGRKTSGYIEGQIKISGYPKKQETFARVSGYCEQTDIHSPHVTVYESLQYSAWLRLPAEVDSSTRKMFVDEVMELVELTPLWRVLVGLPGTNGLSIEQRKRLTIAVELVANPSIIFMDEPTSGLDARAAAIVMRTVRNTVNTGRTVVCTIHQPSIDIFDAFDELLLLKTGGEEIYVGPLGSQASELIKYFEGIDGVSKIKDGYNPATWMLEVTSPSQEATLGVNFANMYKNSELYRRNQGLIKQLSIPPPGLRELYFPSQFSLSFKAQCMACLWKQYLSYWRNPHYTAVRFFMTTGIAVLLGVIFWDLGQKRGKQVDISNAMGSMYIAVLLIGVQNSLSVQPVVSIERTVFYRERAAGMYSELPYAFAQAAIELPYILVQSLTYGVIVYTMIGFEWTFAKFMWYLVITFFTFSYFTYYGMMAVGITPNLLIASIVSSAFYGLFNLFSGYVLPRTRAPAWWKWYYYINPMAWSLYGLLASQFGDVNEKIEGGVTVAEFVRDFFGFEHDFVVYCAVITGGFALLFVVIFAFSIKAFNFQKR